MINYEVALAQFEIFLLILMRIASFIAVAPFFNTANTPARIKIGLSFFVSLLVYTVHPDMAVEYNGVIEYAVLVIRETCVGIFIGFVTFACVQIINFAGSIIDLDTGLTMAQMFDPTTKARVGIFGNLYYYSVMLLLMISGLHRYLIEAIVQTYQVIPIGKSGFAASLYSDIIGFMSDYFVIGFRIALPVFAATLLLNCILAILAKIAPQMNMLVVGMQLKIFTGILVVFFTIQMLPAVSTMLETQVENMISEIVKGLMLE